MVDNDRERIGGSAPQHRGAAKEGLGKVLGDEKRKAEGKMDKAEGKVRNVVSSAKDAVRYEQTQGTLIAKRAL